VFSLDDDVALAVRLADEAAAIALPYFRRGVVATRKVDGTPVSEADVDVERHLLGMLASERPDDAVLSEESGARGDSGRRWILDPIDGTFNFVAANPSWGTHVALEIDGQLVVGVITRPVFGARWWAARGRGAHRDSPTGSGASVQVSTVSDLAESRVCFWAREHHDAADRVRASSRWVEPAIDNVLDLIEGKLEAIVIADPIPEAWDQAPAVVLVTEAGGRFRDGQGGQRIDLGRGLYTNGIIDTELDSILKGVP
jgi:histidinol-phosphatase